MSFIQTIESKLEQMLVKDAPVQLPESWRNWLGTYAWIFALAGFILGILALVVLLPVLGFASFIAAPIVAGRLLLFSWLAFFIELGYVILLGFAIPRLRRKEKSGWDLIFYSSLFFLVYNVFYWFQTPSFGAIFSLLWGVAWSIVGLYFIFQIRGQFSGPSLTSQKTEKGTSQRKGSVKKQ